MIKLTTDIFNLTSGYLDKRFSGMIGDSGFTIEDPKGNMLVNSFNADQRSEILIFGSDLTLRLQILFNSKDFKIKINHLYEGGATNDRVDDFFKELANVTCGKVKEIMIKQGIHAALSLPIAVNSNEKQIQTRSEILNSIKEGLLVKDNQVVLTFRMGLAIHNQSAFTQFNGNMEDETETAGEIEFF